jgi:hypothetical protein
MTFTNVPGNWGFTTVYAAITNNKSGPRTFRVVKVVRSVKDDTELSRTNELIAVGQGETREVYENVNNGTTVLFRVFRRDYDTSGEYTETKVFEDTANPPLAPNGPR